MPLVIQSSQIPRKLNSLRDLPDNPVIIIQGDVREVLPKLPDDSFHCVMSGPPYFNQRDYGYDEQMGREKSLALYVEELVGLYRHVRETLHRTGGVWTNIGDGFTCDHPQQRLTGIGKDGGNWGAHSKIAGSRARDSTGPQEGRKAKDLILAPAAFAAGLRDDDWWLRDGVVWDKVSTSPEHVTDRGPHKHEDIFRHVKSERGAYYDLLAVKPEFRTDVWRIAPQRYRGDHSAVFPVKLAEICYRLGSSERGCCPSCRYPWKRQKVTNGSTHYEWQPSCRCPTHTPVPCTVLDLFSGTGSASQAAIDLGRRVIAIEFKSDYVRQAVERLRAALAREEAWACRLTIEEYVARVSG